MKSVDFLKTLKIEGKLSLVEPSDIISKSYVEKAESNLESAKILHENNKLEESVSLAYYSMYHLLTSLLFKVGIKCENHTGSIIILKEIFNVDNKYILSAKKERVDKQYYVDFHITKEEVGEMIKEAEKFNKKIYDLIEKLQSKNIKEYLEKYTKIV
jgi:uncharacterized protein (UPF0332 family)